ncbi:tuftelin 1b [Ctenopharyngodon idella]|uniref:tuftelin 1b n=1 Tax=Ctenopharyngodon idella TaxID=7959 RepID=UPI00222F1806|nr:tuftelin 1b [Ctenopharyngodon idella]XP_051728091.1 tuftelin 1b [Ctenopharyngodon idella]XP_051728092.1 tuftelin 1b [Ctenopharyngodon idella]XP_051728093.1 tuftelin 1b [Ctenopharyngodon idella]XP_051728094.1 tuftelin 1b [Ctenopharyngodon idella]
MLTDEVSQVQEVRYCLKTLREQMAARQNNNISNKTPSNGFKVDVLVSKASGSNGFVNGSHSKSQGQEDDENCIALREVTKHLYTRLQEMERRHQEEKERLQAENTEYQRRFLEEHNSRMQKAETKAEEQSKKVEEMQKLMDGLELENATLREKLAASEAELEKLRGLKNTDSEDKSEQLKKELATLKDKNHNLDDMLKSQQRKIRNMIEQVQNSRTVMEQRDRLIGDLKERVAFLEAESREMHDRMEYYMGSQVPKPYNSDMGSKVVYSKPLTPTSPGNKSLPFIKVVEIKS